MANDKEDVLTLSKLIHSEVILSTGDAALASKTEQCLAAEHITLKVCARGSDIVEQARTRKPAAILIDAENIGLRPSAVCAALRTIPEAFGIPLLVISSNRAASAISGVFAAGADEYVFKPFREGELASKLLLAFVKKSAYVAALELPSGLVVSGKYRIEKRIGGGGFGQVYHASDLLNSREVAVKMVELTDRNNIPFFLREAFTLSLIRHTNVLKMLDFGTYANRGYIVTEYLDGRSLAETARNSPLSETFAEKILNDLISVMKLMKFCGIVHRDIKPANLIIGEDARVTLIDFGLAKLPRQQHIREHELRGTVEYMAPEYLKKSLASEKSDIYSAGATLYYALTGYPPYSGTMEEIMKKQEASDFPPIKSRNPLVSSRFAAIIQSMLETKTYSRPNLENLENIMQDKTSPSTDAKNKLAADALAYHSKFPAGKITSESSKSCETQADLSLAYTPGVAVPCMEIHHDVENVWKYTGRGNSVAVVSDGTAVLGLGDIGPEAGMPVMEGKAVLFNKFAAISSVPICLGSVRGPNGKTDPKKVIEVVKTLEPTFGGINLEDIGAPACFEIETTLKGMMKIPVFHDDQHGTAIISLAGILNALHLAGKRIEDCKFVMNGAGAAGIACAEYYITAGARRENFILCDSKGAIHSGRTDLNEQKKRFAREISARTLAEAVVGADVFMGVSVANVLTKEMVKTMNDKAIVFAMANPNPEINPADALEAGAFVVGTGRTDYPNQVNNVLGFPGIFRGALDVRASDINEAMMLAASEALAELTREPLPENIREILIKAYPADAANGVFDGEVLLKRTCVIPKPFDPRVVPHVAAKVAEAAVKTGVAGIKIADFKAYEKSVMERIANAK